ncbi:hypothetical protein DICSQDRAFT_181412 [Dichomitus squalens LYAD-421 SS1]|uniref:Uncharacterized protein n=1 Tax=Dichomitus squalens (strain LYAD-421) TaxID=732165 RepID=R7SZ76_DICSQ|nr:uncharacterized protein DICSQDRAFT_181412 [Dichomitus squalens LYAD-421 SS1]EJF60262.1 hypothetical protein DICSQDRAFT_181412 [Dichomitus squalens LYAD-421 SS1]
MTGRVTATPASSPVENWSLVPRPHSSRNSTTRVHVTDLLYRHWVVICGLSSNCHVLNFPPTGYEDPYSHHLQPIFERARMSFEEANRPNAHTAELILAARTEFLSTLSSPPTCPTQCAAEAPRPTQATPRPPHHNNPAPYVVVHIRKGDRRPAAFVFHPDQAIPLGEEDMQMEFDLEPEEERARLTRGRVVDLAMVSGL